MTTLTQRLLCAARQAYEIRPGVVAAYVEAPPPVAISETACIAYEVPPTGFLADTQDVDAAFAAVIPEGVLISIRGTISPRRLLEQPLAVLIDWSKNAHANLISTQMQSVKFPGKVHPEFYLTFRNLWDGPNGLGSKVQALLQQHPGKTRVLVTGHSKGGAICPLVAWRLHEIFAATPALANHRITVRAFAPARVGDPEFAAAYNGAANIDHVRYEYDDDLVPHLPVRTALLAAIGMDPATALAITNADPGYGEVGRLRYIDANGAYADKSDAARVREIGDRLRPLQILSDQGVAYVLNCHDIGKGSGYAKARYDAPDDQ